MPKYWLAVHKRLRSSDIDNSEDAWRYRKITGDSCKKDPEWEKGRYNTCLNIPEKASKDDWIFDAVCPTSATGLRVIRSAFQITDKQEGTLHFESYYFLDGGWREGKLLTNRRGAHEVDSRRGKEWVNIIQNLDTYNLYRGGDQANSQIDHKWNEMVARTPSD